MRIPRPDVIRTFLTVLILGVITTPASSHGLMTEPLCRAAGSANEDYQYCFGTPDCVCGEFPDAGPVVATYTVGQAIEVTIEVTITHASGPVFRFQLCPPDEISPECFEAGEFAVRNFDQITGIHSYELDLPPELECDPCVLRWKWDYGFLSCSDVRIKSGDVRIGGPASWSTLKARYR
jgi:hypothetical protein